MQILRSHKINFPRKYVYLVALFFSLIVILQISNTDEKYSIQKFLGYIILFTSNYFVWALMIDYISGAIASIGQLKTITLRVIVKVLLSFSILIFIHLVITNVLYYSFLYSTTDITLQEVYLEFKPYILKSFLSRFLELLIIGIILKVVEAYQVIQKQKTKMISLENELHISQLEMLRSQLDPHFLFNTLHTLNTLIGYEDDKAKSMVVKVTNLLRKMLEHKDKHMVTFEEELTYFKNYLDIEQERFHDRLDVKIDIEAETKHILVPTLILQPLIENAFKHGISLIENNGVIHLWARVEDEKLVIQLKNSIPKTDKQFSVPSTKIGLNNLKRRLEQVYSDSFRFITEQDENDFTARIMIDIND